MTPSAAASTDFRLGQRAPRRVWISISAAGAVVSVLLLGWLLTYRPTLGTYRLSGGSVVVLSSITHGKTHRSDDRSLLMKVVDSVTGRRLPGQSIAHTQQDTAMAWIRVAAKRGDAWHGLNHLRVVDSHGCQLGEIKSEPFRNHEGDQALFGLPFEHLPFRGGPLRLEVSYGSQSVGTIPCDVTLATSGPALIPMTLPRRVIADDVAVTLEGVTRDTGHGGHECHAALLNLTPAKGLGGVWSAGWFALTDSSGRRFAKTAGWSPTKPSQRTRFQAPCWRDAAWKMEVGVAPSAGTSVKPDHRWTLNLTVPPEGSKELADVEAGPITLELELERSGYVMASKTRHARQMSLRVKVKDWKGGERLVLDSVNGERLVKRFQRWAIVNDPYLEHCGVVDVIPGAKAEGEFEIPIEDGETALNLRISGLRYRTAEFTFDPRQALK